MSRPFPFSCRRCGNCCALPDGVVRVASDEIDGLAAHLGLSRAGFVSRYLGPPGPGGVCLLKDGPGTACVFLEPGRPAACRVYPVRPAACRSFPYWPELLGAGEGRFALAPYCPGLAGG